jgi:hypothetical protein
MRATLKSSVFASVGLVLLASITPASADRGGDIAAGVIGGAILGGIVGQATGPRRVYVEPAPVYVEPRYRRGCGELRERAEIAEDRGHYERARMLRREYRDCRGD